MHVNCACIPCMAVTTWLLHAWLFHAWLFYAWLFHAWHMVNYMRCVYSTPRENMVHANTWWGYLQISHGTTHWHASKIKVIIEWYHMLWQYTYKTIDTWRDKTVKTCFTQNFCNCFIFIRRSDSVLSTLKEMIQEFLWLCHKGRILLLRMLLIW